MATTLGRLPCASGVLPTVPSVRVLPVVLLVLRDIITVLLLDPAFNVV